jgi:hypothetical protein
MSRIALLALTTLLSSPAYAGSWCNGVIASNGDCFVTESPVIVQCDYLDDRRSDPRCVGITNRRHIGDAEATPTPDVPTPQKRRKKR